MSETTDLMTRKAFLEVCMDIEALCGSVPFLQRDL